MSKANKEAKRNKLYRELVARSADLERYQKYLLAGSLTLDFCGVRRLKDAIESARNEVAKLKKKVSDL